MMWKVLGSFILIASLSSPALAADKVFIKFYADWCGACKKLKSTLDDKRVQETLSAYDVYDINVDEDKEYSKAYKVASIPTIIVGERDGDKLKIKERIVGYVSPDELLKKLK